MGTGTRTAGASCTWRKRHVGLRVFGRNRRLAAIRLRSRECQAAEPAGARPKPRWLWIALPAALVIALFSGWWIQRPRADAANLKIHLDEQSVTAVDGDGRELWVHRLDERYRHIESANSDSVRVMPGRDPRVYYLTSQRIGRGDNEADGGEFTSLDSDGETRFTFRFFDNLRFGGQYFGAPWALTAFSVLEGEPTRLAVAAHHWIWSPSLIAILDDTGNRLGTYVSHGWIEQLHWLSRDRLVFGGFLESKNGGMVGHPRSARARRTGAGAGRIAAPLRELRQASRHSRWRSCRAPKSTS